MKATIHIGPFSGMSVYSEADTSRPILHVDACNTSELIRYARDALSCDTLRFIRDGTEYNVQAGIPLAYQILKALYER